MVPGGYGIYQEDHFVRYFFGGVAHLGEEYEL